MIYIFKIINIFTFYFIFIKKKVGGEFLEDIIREFTITQFYK